MGNTCKLSANRKNVAVPSRIIHVQPSIKQQTQTSTGSGNLFPIKQESQSLTPINVKPTSEAQATGEPDEEVKINEICQPLVFKYDLNELGIGEYYLEKDLTKSKSTENKNKQKDNVKWDRIIVQMRAKLPKGVSEGNLCGPVDICIKEFSALKPKSYASMLKKGPPMRYRWSVWKNLIRPEEFYVPELYEKLKNSSSPCEATIRKDLHRSFPNEPYFSSERFNYIGQEQLFNVLKAMSLYFPNVGYTQSMNFVAGFLLLVNGGNELEAFWVFVALARGHRFLAMGFFEKDFSLLKFYFFIFYEVLESEMPVLCEHIKQQQIPDELWLLKWFMSVFIYSLPAKQVVRIWDFIMVEGFLGIIKVSLGLMKVVEKDILSLDAFGIDLLFQHLKNEGNRMTNISQTSQNQSQAQNNNPNQSNLINQVLNPTNQSFNNNHPQVPSLHNLYNLNLTQRDNIGTPHSAHNETSEIHYNVKELDINEVLSHAENITLTVDKMLYFTDLYPEKGSAKLSEPYQQFFKNIHLYQNDVKKLAEFQSEVNFHLLKSGLSESEKKNEEEIIIKNLIDEPENTLILKDLNL